MFYRIKILSITAFFSALLLLVSFKVNAQVTMFSGSSLWESNKSKSCFSETLIFKADAKIYIQDGSAFYFFGKNLIVEPGAEFYGVSADGATIRLGHGGGGIPGFIELVSNPSVSYTTSDGTIESSTVIKTIDGGYIDGAADINTIPCLRFSNPNNIMLVNSDVRIGSSVVFDANQATVVGLDNKNFRLSDEATIAGSGANRYFNTSGEGYLIKEKLASASSFKFPVGYNIANDHTPTRILNDGTVPITFYVNVKNIASSLLTISSNKNIDRVWNIFSPDTSISTKVSLQHNHQTNTLGNATETPTFNNANAFVSQQTAAGTWSLGTISNGGSPISTHSGDFTIPQNNGITAYFTKLSCPQTFNITGGGSYCVGSNGVAVGLDGSEIDINYQLLLNGSAIGTPVAGTGSAISFGLQTAVGTYTVTEFTSSCALNMIGNAIVETNTLPVLTSSTAESVCSNSEFSYTPTSNSSTAIYTWGREAVAGISNSANSGTGSIKETLENTTNLPINVIYQYTVTANNCTSIVYSLVVTVMPTPIVSINKTTNSTNSSVMLTASGANTYTWTTINGGFISNDVSITFEPTTTDIYVLTGTNAYGCNSSAQIKIEGKNINVHPKFPSGITPNGDGRNDAFIIKNVEQFPNNEFLVYNRWGDVVYKKSNYTNSDAWTGVNMHGKTLPEGTYFIIFKEFTSNFSYKGWVYIKWE